ncbi:UPF0287-domain-containing protein [Cutaneotrichosporon oleaginosum]|uniref:COX assembly mitochondrial protein n=1 Tax=Cutaneotrichosporon oleaginosum TaxID=879819 RepID=A0A0J1B8D2_9TREE|nr:UPF0287-domain-containing protein [Cutaneotrichosporon oleaginosum]KLT44024.1 UPF0287-domain-containing protein [Cutaneotrichosporon oleaginosum]TXT04030.1 hypothetical protein COLE_07727 [Cutaneotrichosporon oleaginosum]
MHAPLGVPERQIACADLIQALEECHARGTIAKFFGACNDQKLALNMCLRKERVDRTTRNREASKERNRKKEEAWARLAEERAQAEKQA